MKKNVAKQKELQEGGASKKHQKPRCLQEASVVAEAGDDDVSIFSGASLHLPEYEETQLPDFDEEETQLPEHYEETQVPDSCDETQPGCFEETQQDF